MYGLSDIYAPFSIYRVIIIEGGTVTGNAILYQGRGLDRIDNLLISTPLVDSVALESFEKGALTVAAMESTLEDCLLTVDQDTDDPESEAISLHTFLHLTEDEYAEAIEEAMDKNS